MLVDRTFRDEQFVGDLLVRQAAAYGHQDFAFAGRKLLVGDVLARTHTPRERRQELRAEIAAPRHHRVDGLDHVADVRVLEQETPCPGLHHARIVALLAEHRKGDDPQVGTPRQRPLGGLRAVDTGHGEIHENDVGLQLRQHGEELLAAGRLAHHAAPGAMLQQPPEPVAEKRMVVYKYYRAFHIICVCGGEASAMPAPPAY